MILKQANLGFLLALPLSFDQGYFEPRMFELLHRTAAFTLKRQHERNNFHRKFSTLGLRSLAAAKL